MRKLLAVLFALCLLAAPAHADVYFKDDAGTTVTLKEGVCNVPAARALIESALPGIPADSVRAGSVLFKGKTYEACWTLVNTTVLFVDEEGDGGPIPMQVFKPVDTI